MINALWNDLEEWEKKKKILKKMEVWGRRMTNDELCYTIMCIEKIENE